jgi:hypothetical protein
MRKKAFLTLVGLVAVVGCSESGSPTLSPDRPLFTGYMGGGGRSSTDSTDTSVTSTQDTGYMGGGGKASDTGTPPR